LSNPIIDKIVEDCGSISEFSRRVGVTPQSAHNWVRRGYVPPARALQMEVMFKVPARDLVRPQLREIAELLNG